MAVERYATPLMAAGSQFGPSKSLYNTGDRGKWRTAYDRLLTFSSNHGSILLFFRDIYNITFSVSKMFWPLLAVIQAYGHINQLTSTEYYSNHSSESQFFALRA